METDLGKDKRKKGENELCCCWKEVYLKWKRRWWRQEKCLLPHFNHRNQSLHSRSCAENTCFWSIYNTRTHLFPPVLLHPLSPRSSWRKPKRKCLSHNCQSPLLLSFFLSLLLLSLIFLCCCCCWCYYCCCSWYIVEFFFYFLPEAAAALFFSLPRTFLARFLRSLRCLREIFSTLRRPERTKRYLASFFLAAVMLS